MVVAERRTLIGPFTARQIGLVNAIVVGAALVLFVATRPLGSEAPTTIQPGASFYRISAETQGLQLGQRAPDFIGTNGDQDVRLTDLDGREIRLADFAGKPVWVVFWATWCPPCQQETPDIRAVHEANRDGGPRRARDRCPGTGRHGPGLRGPVRADVHDWRRHVRRDHEDVRRVRAADPLLHRPSRRHP